MFIVVFLSMLCVLGVAHWYLWRRLVRDVSKRGGVWRRTGTVLVFLMPALMVAAQAGGRAEGVPFWLKQVVAWPGLLWFALMVYLFLTVVAFEAVRPLLRRLLERRDSRRAAAGGGPAVELAGAGRPTDAPSTASAPQSGEAVEPGPVERGAKDEAGRGTATAVAAAPLAETAGGSHATSSGTGGSGALPAGAHEGPGDVSRRLFLARAGAVTAGVVTATTVGAGAYSVLGAGPTVKRVRVTLDKLPAAADGYKLTLISDIHLSPVLGRDVCQRIVDKANGTNADLIALVGDLADGSVSDLRSAAAPLRQLRAREGVYFSTGNHEYFSGAREWKAHLSGPLGIRVLDNEREELEHFDLAGVNDLAGEDYDDGPDYAKALSGRDPGRATVLLAHQPSMVLDAKEYGVDLQLSGHTHGGQMWPGNFLAALANPTLYGLDRYDDTQVYVTRGAGAWGPPVRVGAEPDITVLELRSGASGS